MDHYDVLGTFSVVALDRRSGDDWTGRIPLFLLIETLSNLRLHGPDSVKKIRPSFRKEDSMKEVPTLFQDPETSSFVRHLSYCLLLQATNNASRATFLAIPSTKSTRCMSWKHLILFDGGLRGRV